MKRLPGKWSVGTRDNEVVYLNRELENGDLIFGAELTPDEATKIGEALINRANHLLRRGGRL